MNLKNSMISVALASLLVGCGGSSNPKTDPIVSPSPTPTPTPITKSVVCLDINMNALCDSDETFKEVTAWDGNGDSKIAVDSTLTGAPLAYNGVNGYIFTAPANSENIYAGTTMKNNELIYNQVIEEKTAAMAKAYVHPHFSGGKPSAADKKAIADAVKSNIEAHPNESRYAVIAAVMNKLFAASTVPSNIAWITVTAGDIADADVPSLADLNVTATFDVNLTAAKDAMLDDQPKWSSDSKDTTFRYLASKGGKLIASTYEHNGLAVIDTAGETLVYSPASVLTDAGHGVLSVSADATSGPSEPALSAVALSSDGSTVYYNVPAKSDKSNKAIIGLFKAAVGSDGSIALTEGTFAGGPGVTHAAETRLDMKVKMFSLTNDDSKVVVYDAEKNLRLYDADLANELGATDDASVEALTSVAATASNVYTAAAGSTMITKRGISGTLDAVGTIEIGFAPDEMQINADGTKLIGFTHGHDHGGVTSIALVDLATGTLIDSGEVAFKSDGATISPDFNSIALFGHEEETTDIINLTVKGFSTQGRYAQAGRSATFIDNNTLALTDKKKVYVLNIATTTNNNTLAEEMVLAKESINQKNINGGTLSVIIKDLTLSPTYGGIDIAWTSSGLPTGVLNTQTGAITRPANGAGDATGGTLNAALTGSFRYETIEETKEFTDLSVRQMPKMIPASQMHSVPAGRADYLAANADGTVMVGPIRDAEDVYSMGSFKADTADAVSIASAPFRLDENETVRGAGIVGDYAIFTTSHKDENRSRIYSVAIAADGTLAKTITSEVVNAIPGAQPEKMEWTADNSKAAVILKDSNKKYHGAIYNVGTNGVITTDKTFAFDGVKVANHGPMVINDDATLVYQKDGSRTHVLAVNTTTGAVDTNATDFPNSIARLWFAHGFLFEHDYEGNIVTLDKTTLTKLHTFHTGTGGRMYGGEGRIINGKNYYIIPVQQAGETVNGVYIFEVLATGELKEIAFANNPAGADRMAVSGDGKTVFYGFRDEAGKRHIGTVKITDSDL